MKRGLIYLNLALWSAVYIRLADSISLGSAALFWGSLILYLVDVYRLTGYRALLLSIAGTSLNAIASLGNGGRMPVLGVLPDAGCLQQDKQARTGRNLTPSERTLSRMADFYRPKGE